MRPVGSLDQREAQPCRIVVELPDRDALGADVAVREDVIIVAPDLDDLIGFDRQRQAARRFAQRAGTEGGLGHSVRLGARAHVGLGSRARRRDLRGILDDREVAIRQGG